MPVPVHRLPLEEEPLLGVVKVVRLQQAKPAPAWMTCPSSHRQRQAARPPEGLMTTSTIIIRLFPPRSNWP